MVSRSVSHLRQELGSDLLAIWLCGSRARGEADPMELDEMASRMVPLACSGAVPEAAAVDLAELRQFTDVGPLAFDRLDLVAGGPVLSCWQMNGRSDSALAGAALSPVEQGVVRRSVSRLEEELGPDLLAVWLYGSRARGDADPAETDPDRRSDIDLMAIVNPARDAGKIGWVAHELVEAEADAAGDSPVYYSLRVFDTDWLHDRRRIRSFFIQEVDRDKIVLYGNALEKPGLSGQGDG